MVVEVTFKGNRREFFDWPYPEAPAAKTPVIVAVERGEDFGRVHATGELARTRRAGTTHGQASRDPLRKVLRAASSEEIARATQLRADEHNVRVRAIEKVRALGLDLKVSDIEWQWDRKRLTVYFTSDQRVDFRQLVRQLEGLFGTRVHMWHIGVRDEAKRVDGIGRCGRQMCSASWLPELVPVKSSVAKDQHLSTLNPAQISGVCGRLMCCLRYEHEFYVAQRKRFPKEGRVLKTLTGEEKVLSLDIFRETVTLRALGGETRVVPLVQLRQELQGERPAWADRMNPDSGAAASSTDTGTDTDTGDDDEPRREAAGTAEATTPDGSDEPSDESSDEPMDVDETKPPAGQASPPGASRRRRRGRRGGRRGRGGTPGQPPRTDAQPRPPLPPRRDEPHA